LETWAGAGAEEGLGAGEPIPSLEVGAAGAGLVGGAGFLGSGAVFEGALAGALVVFAAAGFVALALGAVFLAAVFAVSINVFLSVFGAVVRSLWEQIIVWRMEVQKKNEKIFHSF
jgi:hypothetical protein